MIVLTKRPPCADSPEVFFPSKGASPKAAKAICAGCDIRDKCLEEALSGPFDLSGVWGGTTEEERRKIRRGRR